MVRVLYAQAGHRVRYASHIPYARSIDHVRFDAYHMHMNEQVVRIVTSQTMTTFVQVQDAVTDPSGHVLVPPRLQAVPQPMLYQVGQPLPTPDGAPQEPLIVIAIIESFDEESGELIEYEVYSAGDKDSVYERTNRAVVTRIPGSEVTRKDCRVYANEMTQALQEYAAASAEQQQQQVPQQLQQTPPPQYAPQYAPPQRSGTGQAPPPMVGGMGNVEAPMLRTPPSPPAPAQPSEPEPQQSDQPEQPPSE